MIARIAGRLEKVSDAAALIDTGDGLWYEVLLPAYEASRLSQNVGQDVVLHTIHYLDGDPSRGGQTPRLVGFAAEQDRAFLKLFTSVKGIGIRKALRALARPVEEIASAIAAQDVSLLATLPEIGKRTAQQIVAELHEKVDAFAGAPAGAGPKKPELPEAALEAASVLVQLGEKRADAMAMVQRVLADDGQPKTAEEIIQHAYKLKVGGM